MTINDPSSRTINGPSRATNGLSRTINSQSRTINTQSGSINGLNRTINGPSRTINDLSRTQHAFVRPPKICFIVLYSIQEGRDGPIYLEPILIDTDAYRF